MFVFGVSSRVGSCRGVAILDSLANDPQTFNMKPGVHVQGRKPFRQPPGSQLSLNLKPQTGKPNTEAKHQVRLLRRSSFFGSCRGVVAGRRGRL